VEIMADVEFGVEVGGQREGACADGGGCEGVCW
jgi:hypothetical protein